MKRRLFLTSTLAIPFMPRTLAAQRAARVARIGWLTAQKESSLTPFLNALRAGFADYGYEEGRNLVIEYRYGNDAIERANREPQPPTFLIKRKRVYDDDGLYVSYPHGAPAVLRSTPPPKCDVGAREDGTWRPYFG